MQEVIRMCRKKNGTNAAVWITVTALFMAMNIVLSLSIFSIPVPGGHLYLCDVIICTAAILLDPFAAFLVGGVGSFIGDFLFYPAPMFVSLAAHGLQALVISVLAHYILKKHPILASGIGVAAGAVIMVVGYTLGRAFIYATPEYAIVKLPYEILQALLGAVLSMILCWKAKLANRFRKITHVQAVQKHE